MTKKEAKRLSILKWEWIVDHDGSEDETALYDAIPELRELEANCPYCELYFNQQKKCLSCPLAIFPDKKGTQCTMPNHPFDNWLDNANKKNAKEVLDLIIETGI